MDAHYSWMFLLQMVHVTVGATKCRNERSRSIPTKTIITTMIQWMRETIPQTKRRPYRPDSWARLCASTSISVNRYPVRINKIISRVKLSLCEPLVDRRPIPVDTTSTSFFFSVYIPVSEIHSCLSPSFYLPSFSHSPSYLLPECRSFDIKWTRRVKNRTTREINKIESKNIKHWNEDPLLNSRGTCQGIMRKWRKHKIWWNGKKKEREEASRLR